MPLRPYIERPAPQDSVEISEAPTRARSAPGAAGISGPSKPLPRVVHPNIEAVPTFEPPARASLDVPVSLQPAPSESVNGATPGQQAVGNAYRVFDRYVEEGRKYAAGQSGWNNPATGLPAGWASTADIGADVLGQVFRLINEVLRLLQPCVPGVSSPIGGGAPAAPEPDVIFGSQPAPAPLEQRTYSWSEHQNTRFSAPPTPPPSSSPPPQRSPSPRSPGESQVVQEALQSPAAAVAAPQPTTVTVVADPRPIQIRQPQNLQGGGTAIQGQGDSGSVRPPPPPAPAGEFNVPDLIPIIPDRSKFPR